MSNINRRGRSRRVSAQQLDLIWEFLNSHRDVANAYNRSLQAKEYSKKKWAELTLILNAQSGGAFREPSEWSKYWVDWKAKLKKKISSLRSAQCATGGGPSTEQPLTEIEKKFLQILGEDFGQGLPGVRVEPFPQSSTTIDVDTAPPAPTVSEVVLQIECPDEALMAQDVVYSAIQVSPQASPAAPTQSPPSNTQPLLQQSPRRRRRRREPPMTQEAARRALVESARLRAEASLRSSLALEGMQQNLEGIHLNLERSTHSMQTIELILGKIERYTHLHFDNILQQESYKQL